MNSKPVADCKSIAMIADHTGSYNAGDCGAAMSYGSGSMIPPYSCGIN